MNFARIFHSELGISKIKIWSFQSLAFHHNKSLAIVHFSDAWNFDKKNNVEKVHSKTSYTSTIFCANASFTSYKK